MMLFFFFSMDTKTAAENSLYIIFFSQTANLAAGIVTGSIPDFAAEILLLMVSGGIAGGICGRFLNRKIQEKTVVWLFIGLMLVMIGIYSYNIVKFM